MRKNVTLRFVAASLKDCGKLNVKARDLILYTDLSMYASYVVRNCPYVMNGLEDIKARKLMKTHFVPFLAYYSKKMTAFTNMKQFFFGKIRYLFLTYQEFVMVFCLVFSKYFFENMGFLYTPSIQWPMEAHSMYSW